MKKKYVSPELEVLILEQTDIITSSPTTSGGTGGSTGTTPGFEDDLGDLSNGGFGWDS